MQSILSTVTIIQFCHGVKVMLPPDARFQRRRNLETLVLYRTRPARLPYLPAFWNGAHPIQH